MEHPVAMWPAPAIVRLCGADVKGDFLRLEAAGATGVSYRRLD